MMADNKKHIEKQEELPPLVPYNGGDAKQPCNEELPPLVPCYYNPYEEMPSLIPYNGGDANKHHDEEQEEVSPLVPHKGDDTNQQNDRTLGMMHIYQEMEKEGEIFNQGELCKGRTLIIDGKEYDDFSSVVYLGMEYHLPAIKAFYERALECGLAVRAASFFLITKEQKQLVKELEDITGGKVLVTTSTSNASACFADIALKSNDIVVFEKERTHASFLIYGAIAKEKGVKFVSVSVLKDGDDAISKIREYATKAKTNGGKVWYATDAWDSSYGRHLPWDQLIKISTIENVGLFIDDAHGFWAFGKRGRGSFLENVPLKGSMIVACSLNKSYGGYGGCLIFSNDENEMYTRARYAALPNIFQGL
jgi:7-keto-8-aminopelargonate synthetase-like enzyme